MTAKVATLREVEEWWSWEDAWRCAHTLDAIAAAEHEALEQERRRRR